MKRYVLIALSLLPLHLAAQQFRGGIIAGINGSQVDGDHYAGYNKLGIMAGFFVYRPVSEKLDIQLEIKYMGKGASKKTTKSDLVQYKSQLHYVEMPLLLHYKASRKLGIEAGLGFGYLFSYAEKDEYGEIPIEDAAKFNAFELSSIIGLRYNIKPFLALNLRYSYSILPILNSPGDITYFFNRGAYNNLFSIGVMYELGQK
jgi:hypothetical protein